MLELSHSFLSIQEREHAIIHCTYQKKTFYNFHWFRHDPGKGLVSLTLTQSSQKEQTDQNFKEVFGKEKLYTVFHIPACHAGDSATYCCAVQHRALQAPALCTTTLQLI